MPIYVLLFPCLISIHIISWSWSSMSTILLVLFLIVSLMTIATPPPCLFRLLFVSHEYPGMFGVCDVIFVSVIHLTVLWEGRRML